MTSVWLPRKCRKSQREREKKEGNKHLKIRLLLNYLDPPENVENVSTTEIINQTMMLTSLRFFGGEITNQGQKMLLWIASLHSGSPSLCALLFQILKSFEKMKLQKRFRGGPFYKQTQLRILNASHQSSYCTRLLNKRHACSSQDSLGTMLGPSYMRERGSPKWIVLMFLFHEKFCDLNI